MDRSGNPWIVYPGDIPGDDYLEISENWVFLEAIVWAGYTSANHICDVKDSADREVFFRQGVSDLSDVKLEACPRVRGLRVYTLDSGQLYIYIR